MKAGRASSQRTRTLIVAGIFAGAFLGLLLRLGYLQVVKHDEYLRIAEGQHAKSLALRPKRGPILDRNGQVLAVSSGAETLYALPGRVDDPARLARRLAPALGEPAADIARRLDSAKRFVYVKRRLPPAVAQAVRELKEPALGFLEESLRLYPNRELASQVVGFEGAEGKGLGGIEQAWDAHLAGQEGRALVERDALGREVTGGPVILKPSRPGQGVVLTLDATLQYIAEKEIDAAWRRTRARAAMAVAMDPRTGEILALAIRPTFNPNAFATATDDERRNRAVTDPFEPGSTFKVILAAAALEEGVARPTDRFYGENGAITIASATIHDWKKYGWLTFTEVLQNSSNVGSIKVGLSLGKERYYKYITGFGFGTPTGVGLPGESRGQLRAPDRWSGLSLATMSIGQEISVTALQMVSAFAAVANGGTPHAAADRARDVGRTGPRDAGLRAQGDPPGDRAGDGAHAHRHHDAGGVRRHRPQRRHRRLRGRGQDGHRPEDGSGHPPILARPRRPVLRGLRPRRRPAPGHDRAAGRAEEREMGQRGGRPHLCGHRHRGAPLPARPAEEYPAVQIVRPDRRDAASAARHPLS